MIRVKHNRQESKQMNKNRKSTYKEKERNRDRPNTCIERTKTDRNNMKKQKKIELNGIKHLNAEYIKTQAQRDRKKGYIKTSTETQKKRDRERQRD